MKHEKAFAYLAFFIVCTVWGTTYLAIRVAIESLPVILFPGVRFTIAGLVLMSIRLAMGDRLPRKKSDWANLTLIGFLMVGVGNLAVVWAEQWVTSGFAALLVGTAPFWMSAMESRREPGRPIEKRRVAGMLVGFAGVIVLVLPELMGSRFDRNFLLGVIGLQLATIAWNFGSLRSKYHPPQTSALMSAALQMLLGGGLVTIAGVLHGDIDEFRFTTRTLIAFLYLTVFGSILAYGAYVYALSKLKASTVSMYAYINPAVAVFLGWLILDEPLGWNAIAAMAVIFAGVALVQTARVRTTAQPRVAPAILQEEEPVV